MTVLHGVSILNVCLRKMETLQTPLRQYVQSSRILICCTYHTRELGQTVLPNCLCEILVETYAYRFRFTENTEKLRSCAKKTQHTLAVLRRWGRVCDASPDSYEIRRSKSRRKSAYICLHLRSILECDVAFPAKPTRPDRAHAPGAAQPAHR